MNSARIVRKGSNPQQLLTDSPFHNQKIKESQLQASSTRNTAFSTKRASLVYPNSSNKKTENVIQQSHNEQLQKSNFLQSLPQSQPPQYSHSNNFYHKVAPFQGQINIEASSNLIQNYKNPISSSLLTPRSLIPGASASQSQRNLIEFKKSIESQEKVKTEGFDKHQQATEHNTSRGKIKNVEYFALVKSICRNHGQFFNTSTKINQDPQYNLISQERSSMVEINLSGNNQKNTPRIVSNREAKENTVAPSLRALKDFQNDYKQTKIKIIKDRKWLAKTKKMFTEGRIDFNGNNIDKCSQQLLPSNVSLKLFPREDEEQQCQLKQLSKYQIDQDRLSPLKLASTDASEAHKVLLSSNNQFDIDTSPQHCDLMTPKDQLPREQYPFRISESQQQGSYRNSETIIQSKVPLQVHYRHIDTWQDISFNENNKKQIMPQQQKRNEFKQAQSEWQSQQEIEGEKQSAKQLRIECPSRDGENRPCYSNLGFYSHRTLRGNDNVLNKEEQKVVMLLETKQSKDIDKFKSYKLTSRNELKKESELKRQKKQQRETDSKQIKELQEALLSRGLIQSEESEDDLLATKLRIHNYFRQNTLTQTEKQYAYQRLFEQFNVKNNSPSFRRSNQIAQNLRNMKSFYLQQKQETKVVNFQKKTKSVYDLLQSSQKKISNEL